MIKGCAKRVVVVRDIDSNFFEEAFFIVKQGEQKNKATEADFIGEANRIVRSDLPEMQEKKQPLPEINRIYTGQKNKHTKKYKGILRDVLMFVFGFGISAVVCTFIYDSGMII